MGCILLLDGTDKSDPAEVEGVKVSEGMGVIAGFLSRLF